MKDDTTQWLAFAQENLSAAHLLLEHQLLNACLQNVQQSVEKFLKATLIHLKLRFKKTHSIRELTIILSNANIHIHIPEEDLDFLDSIYLPSKYPLGSALPDFYPDEEICRNALTIAELIRLQIINLLNELKA